MVGGGQLARMTAQAAIGLGIELPRAGRRRPRDSAAQVCARDPARRLPARRRTCWRSRAGCDVVTFDHEHVPGEHLAALEQAGTAVRPGGARAALHPGQARRCGERAGSSARRAVPAVPRRCSSLAEVDRRSRRGRRLAGGAQGTSAAATTARASGSARRRERRPPHGARRHGIGLLVEEYVPFDRELAVLVARSPHGQGAAYPVVQTVQRDGICREVIAPAPGLARRASPCEAQRLGLQIAAELGVTGLLAVELFETGGRAAGQRAGDAAAQQRSLDHRRGRDLAVRAAPAGRARPAARRAGADRAGRGDGQRARRRRPGPVLAAAST